jgi:hypothetical protein
MDTPPIRPQATAGGGPLLAFREFFKLIQYTTAKTIFFLPRTHDLVRFFSENINKCLLIGY